MSIIVPVCRSEGSLCEAKLPRQGSVFRRFSLDMGNNFRKSQFVLVIIVLIDSFAVHLCIINLV